MPTSPLKRPSGGRLRRLLASLRPTACAAPFPVQTGFPTSLADIVVKNHGRLKIPRRRRRAPGAAVPPPAAAAAEPASESQQSRELSLPHDDAAAPAPAPARPGKGAGGFSIRPGVLAAGGAVALALLVIWSKQLVAASTLASVALSWIESAMTVRARRGHISPSPIRGAAESPSPRSNGGGRDATDDDTSDLGCGDSPSSVGNSKRKQSRRSLRKLLAGKLRNGKTPRGAESHDGGDAGEHEHELPETPRRLKAEPAAAARASEATLPEAITDDERCRSRRQRGGAIPLPALVPIILAGLIAGKLPALALAVLCVAFSSSVERVAVPENSDAIPR